MDADRCSAEYLKAIELFNAGEFFECHDVLEEIWSETLGEDREFYQGLIHAAVSLFHFERGNLGGARKMYTSTCRYLKPYCPHFQGIDLNTFLSQYETCLGELLQAGSVYPEHVTLDPQLLPTIPLPAADGFS